MDRAVKGESEGAEPEMGELQDVGPGIIKIDDEDEIEELHKR